MKLVYAIQRKNIFSSANKMYQHNKPVNSQDFTCEKRISERISREIGEHTDKQTNTRRKDIQTYKLQTHKDIPTNGQGSYYVYNIIQGAVCREEHSDERCRASVKVQ